MIDLMMLANANQFYKLHGYLGGGGTPCVPFFTQLLTKWAWALMGIDEQGNENGLKLVCEENEYHHRVQHLRISKYGYISA